MHLRIFSQGEVRTCKPRVGSKANTLIFLEMPDGSGSAKDQRENEPRPAIAPVMMTGLIVRWSDGPDSPLCT